MLLELPPLKILNILRFMFLQKSKDKLKVSYKIKNDVNKILYKLSIPPINNNNWKEF